MGDPQKRKADAGRHAAFPNTSNDPAEVTAPHGFRQRIKRLIVTLALWGVLPIPAADSLIRRSHLGAE